MIDLVDVFQAGGLFGSDSAGSEGVLAALGLSPEVVGIIKTIFDGIQDAMTGFDAGGISGLFGSILETIGKVLTDGWNNIVLPALQGWRDQFFSWLMDIYPQIPGRLTELVTNISTSIEENWPTIKKSLSEWSTLFWGWVDEAISQVGAVMLGLAIALAAWATSGEGQAAMTDLGENIGGVIFDALGLGLSNQANSNEAMANMAIALLGAVGTIAMALVVIAGQIVAGIAAGIIEKMTGGEIEVATFSELSGILEGIGKNIGKIAGVIGRRIVDGISNTIKDLAKTWEKIKTNASETWKSIQKTIETVLDSIKSNVSSIWNNVKSTIDSTLNSIKSTVSNAWNSIKSTISSVMSSVLSNISLTWTSIVSTIQQKAQQAVSTATSTLGQLPGQIINLGGQMLSAGVSIMNQLLSGISSRLQTIRDTLVNGVISAINSMISAITGGSIATSLISAGQSILNKLIDGIKAVTNLASELINKVSSSISSMVSAVTSGGIANSIFNAGKSIITGLINGISANASKVYDKLLEIIDDAIDGILDFLGAGSPSKLMFSIGSDVMMAGLQQGIAAMAPTIKAQLQAAITAPVASVAGPALGTGGTGSVTNVFNTGNNIINNEVDAAIFESRVLDVIRRNLG
ncbi:MAG: phage tail protein [Nitrospiria bacterium]